MGAGAGELGINFNNFLGVRAEISSIRTFL